MTNTRRSFFTRLAQFAAVIAIAPQIAFGRKLRPFETDEYQNWIFDTTLKDVRFLKYDLGQPIKIHRYKISA